MISAFGVDHGISKAYRSLKPKLIGASSSMARRGVNPTIGGGSTPGGLNQRARWNYAVMRNNAGRPADFQRQFGIKGRPSEKMIRTARKEKDMANASVTAANNMNRRRNRVLP